MNFVIKEMQPFDWPQVSAIYFEGIRTGIATFERDVPTWDEWNCSHTCKCRLVACSGNIVLGWAALTSISSRCVYSGVAEVSVYTGDAYKRRGVGTALLEELIRQSEDNGFWTLQANIIKENISSRNLHKKCGFREVGIREKIGKMPDGQWHDVILMERRSKKTGI